MFSRLLLDFIVQVCAYWNTLFSKLLLGFRRSDVSEYGSSRRLPNSGTALQPLDTILEEPEYLDSMDEILQIFWEVLHPSVIYDNAAEVRAFLITLADGGSHLAAKEAIEKVRQRTENEVEERLSSSATGVRNNDSEVFKPNNSQKDCVSQYVNFICPQTGLSTLSFALDELSISVVIELLHWGANPNYVVTTTADEVCDIAVTCTSAAREPLLSHAIDACELISCCPVFSDDEVCSDCEQCIELAIRAIEALLTAGCKITPSDWRSLFLKVGIGRMYLVLFEMFVHDATLIPIGCVVKAVRSGFTSVSELCSRPGLQIYWSSDCLTNSCLLEIMANYKSTHFLLRLPMRTRQQKAYKTLFCQIALIKFLSAAYSHLRSRCHCPQAFLSILLEQGANIHGWSEVQAKAMANIFNTLHLQSSYWFTRQTARLFSNTQIERLAYFRTTSLCFLTESNFSWDMSQIPFVRDNLRDQQATVTMEEQEAVSVSIRTRSNSNWANLQALCRDVILSHLLSSDDIMNAVDALPLPLTVKCFLLSNK